MTSDLFLTNIESESAVELSFLGKATSLRIDPLKEHGVLGLAPMK